MATEAGIIEQRQNLVNKEVKQENNPIPSRLKAAATTLLNRIRRKDTSHDQLTAIASEPLDNLSTIDNLKYKTGITTTVASVTAPPLLGAVGIDNPVPGAAFGMIANGLAAEEMRPVERIVERRLNQKFAHTLETIVNKGDIGIRLIATKLAYDMNDPLSDEGNEPIPTHTGLLDALKQRELAQSGVAIIADHNAQLTYDAIIQRARSIRESSDFARNNKAMKLVDIGVGMVGGLLLAKIGTELGNHFHNQFVVGAAQAVDDAARGIVMVKNASEKITSAFKR